MDRNKDFHSDLQELQPGNREFELQPIEDTLMSEGLTIAFLLSLSNERKSTIAKELTPSKIQQEKFKRAVQQLQLQNHDETEEDNDDRDEGKVDKSAQEEKKERHETPYILQAFGARESTKISTIT
eukprot:1012906_1